jgi:hypothetical protein
MCAPAHATTTLGPIQDALCAPAHILTPNTPMEPPTCQLCAPSCTLDGVEAAYAGSQWNWPVNRPSTMPIW